MNPRAVEMTSKKRHERKEARHNPMILGHCRVFLLCENRTKLCAWRYKKFIQTITESEVKSMCAAVPAGKDRTVLVDQVHVKRTVTLRMFPTFRAAVLMHEVNIFLVS